MAKKVCLSLNGKVHHDELCVGDIVHLKAFKRPEMVVDGFVDDEEFGNKVECVWFDYGAHAQYGLFDERSLVKV